MSCTKPTFLLLTFIWSMFYNNTQFQLKPYDFQHLKDTVTLGEPSNISSFSFNWCEDWEYLVEERIRKKKVEQLENIFSSIQFSFVGFLKKSNECDFSIRELRELVRFQLSERLLVLVNQFLVPYIRVIILGFLLFCRIVLHLQFYDSAATSSHYFNAIRRYFLQRMLV